MSQKLSPEEIEAAGLTQEEAEALDGYLSDTEPALGVDQGPSEDFSNIIVVDGLPVAPLSKFDKLLAFVSKIFGSVGKLKEGGIYLGKDEAAGQNTGFAFVEYASLQEAEKALAATNGMKFDAKHQLVVNRYEDLARFADLPSEFQDPITRPWAPRPELWDWLGDEQQRDQLVLRFAEGSGQNVSHETEISFVNEDGDVDPVYGGEHAKDAGRAWTERSVKWSPRGTYLATLHPQGVLLWGSSGEDPEEGNAFTEIFRFMHPEVEDVVFSPCERWAMTWNGIAHNDTPDRALIVWDLRTGAELRAFKQVNVDTDANDAVWSMDGSFLARLDMDYTTGRDLIRVYVPPGMGLLEKRSIPAPGASMLSWCPDASRNVLSWFVPEEGDKPATLTLMDLPSRDVLRAKQLFNVEHVKTFWHPQGKYFCVQASMLTKAQAKNRKRFIANDNGAKLNMLLDGVREAPHGTSFELFRMGERSVPTNTLQLAGKVVDFAWEPNGDRFAVVHGRGPTQYDVTFYSMSSSTPAAAAAGDGSTGQEAEWLFTLKDRPICKVFWSPNGNQCVLAGTEGMGGALEFYDVEARVSYATGEHMQCTNVSWDPSGRVICTSKVQPMTNHGLMKLMVENGYKLWSWQGKALSEEGFPFLYDVQWRPRPALLDAKKERAVRKALPSRIAQFEAEDKARREHRSLVQRARKLRALQRFRDALAERKAWMASVEEQRASRGLIMQGDDVQVSSHTYDQVVRQTVERVD